MANRKVVGELVELYHRLGDNIESMEGNVPVEYVVDLKDLQIDVDKMLTNISKRWAAGNKTRGYIPVKHIHSEENPNLVRVHRHHL